MFYIRTAQNLDCSRSKYQLKIVFSDKSSFLLFILLFIKIVFVEQIHI